MTSDPAPASPTSGPEVAGPPLVSPVFGRPSPAASLPWRLSPRRSSEAGVRADGADLPWCALRAATVVGVRHRLEGTSSQDAWAWSGDGERVVLAVADGLGGVAGSGPLAALAAEVGVAAALTSASRSSGPDGTPEAPEAETAASRAVLAANEAATGLDGASTLVVAVVGHDGTVDVARVGDSSAFRLAGGAWSEIFAPPDPDLREPATAALASPFPSLEVARCTLDPGQVLVLVTDGIGDPLRDGPTTVAPGLATGLATAPHPLALAAQADFSRQGCQDDRTVAALWFEAGAG